MSETKAGIVRRAIVRSDEAEVRRRVARVIGGHLYMTWDGDRLRAVSSAEWPMVPAAGLLESVGIFPGRDGWEIEDAPPIVAVAEIRHTLACKSAGLPIGESCECPGFPARVVEDALPVAAPPVDRAQAIRDALIDRLTMDAAVREIDLLLHVLDSDAWTDPKPVMPEILAAIASIGAVRDGNRWRLSDGPPPGWEWRHDGCLALKRLSDPTVHIANVYDDRRWNVYPQDPGHPSIAGGGPCDFDVVAQAAAILACRRAGLFAPPVTTEPPRDAEAQSRPLVAHLNACHRAGWRDGWTADEYAIHMIREGRADKDRFNAERAIVVDREARLATACTTIADLEAQIANLVARLATTTEERDAAMREAASWKDEHGHMHSDRDMQRKRVTELMDQLWAMEAERNAARTDETDAGHRIAQMETLLAQVTAERDEARLNVVDARAHCASWKRRAEEAEGTVIAMRGVLDAPGKAAT